MSNNKHLYEIIGNDPFNIKILTETLWDIKESIFNNLYDAQKSLTNILRFDFNMADVSTMKSNECSYNINVEFISNDKRTAFKTSKFYKKDLSAADINSNANIFNNSVLLFINGELYTNYFIRPYEDITSIVFKLYDGFPNIKEYLRPGFTKAEIKEFIANNAQMTILFVKQHNENSYNINRNTLNNYTLNPTYEGIPIVNFTSSNKLKLTDAFTTWVTYDDERLYKYRMLSSTELRNNGKLYFNEKEQISSLTNVYTYLKNIYLLNSMEVINIPSGTEYFELPIKDMPVPIENIIIFKKSENGVLFDHDTTMTLYYPNIYKFNEVPHTDLILYVYYTDDTKAIGSKYENELELYHRFNSNILEQYKDMSIPDIIKNYNPISMIYDHHDLKKSSVDHLKYRMNKLNEMIMMNGKYYSIYLNKLIGYVPTFDIVVSEIDNIGERERVDNTREISDTSSHVYFSEKCYLFTFKYKINDKINILIDEYQTNELYISYDEKYCYVYIPMRLINPRTSRITVEKFVDYRYKQSILINDNETYHELNIPEHTKIQLSDIYVTEYLTSNEEVYTSTDKYDLFINRDGAYELVADNDFYNYRPIYIKFTDPSDIGKTINVNVNRITFKQVVKGDNTVIINRAINNDRRNILLYRNGRLVPQQFRKYVFSDKVNGPHLVKGIMVKDPSDEYTLIYNSNKYTMVYYQHDIDERGIIDLTGKINKPIDFNWYDIYVNGLRLHRSNVDILGPYIMVLVNVPTLTNLEIYQKNLDSIIDEEYITEDISSRIFNEISDDIKTRYPVIEDTIPDMMKDIINDALDFLEEYLYTDIQIINPDINQITDEMTIKYPTVFINDNNLFINPDMKIGLEESIVFNPDKNTLRVP